jgi:Holliday junction resolvase RusA-like endonuclease
MILAEISIDWESSLLKNQAYYQGDMKKGHTKACVKAMWDIKMLLRPAIGYGWIWNRQRLTVKITAYRPSPVIDAQNLEAAISDAIETAIGVDDREFDIVTIGRMSTANPRIEIEISQED